MTIERERILKEFQTGALTELIKAVSGKGDSSCLLSACIELHNIGAIDIATLVHEQGFEELDGCSFFTVQHFLSKAIPGLDNISVERMMSFVDQIVKSGGEDMAANEPNRAFVQWCAKDVARSDAVIAAARDGDDVAINHLTFALQAKNDLDVARTMVKEFEGRRQLCALTALARLPHSDDVDRGATIDAIAPALDGETDDATRSSILMAVMNALTDAGSKLNSRGLVVVKKALENPGPLCIHQAANALWCCKATLSSDLVESLVECVRHVDPHHDRTIEIIDLAMSRLLNEGFAVEATECVESLLLKASGELQIGKFGTFARELLDAHQMALNSMALKWLLSGRRVLCEGLSELLRTSRQDSVSLSLDFSVLNDVQAYFVCRKAVGYLFMQPVTAGAVLVSALRTKDGAVGSDVGELLFDPLLISYGGELKRFLEAIPTTDPSCVQVRAVLKRQKSYLQGIEACGVIEELHPSEYQRQLERVRMVDFNREVAKKAHQQSIFYDLVHRATLLHGSACVSFVEGSDGNRRPVTIQMQRHSIQTEWPRMETVDPVGLDMVLRIYRIEQLKS